LSLTAMRASTEARSPAGPWSAAPTPACLTPDGRPSPGREAGAAPLLRAVIRPNLSELGWMRHICLAAGSASGVLGFMFAVWGIWIVPALMVLEMTVLGFALAGYRRSALARSEEISVYADHLTVALVNGRLRDEQNLETAWLAVERRPDSGSGRAGIVLRLRDREVPVGAWLGSAQRDELALLIDQALTRVRRGGRAGEGASVFWGSRPV